MHGKELLIFVVVVGLSSAVPELPKNLKRCSRKLNRSVWNNCLKDAIEDGLAKLKHGEPSIKVDPYDPLKIDKIVTTKTGPIISLDVNQKDTEIRGFGDGIKVDKIDFNLEKNYFSGSLLIPKLNLRSHQILKGKIVGIPLTWKGGMICNITKARCDFNAPFEKIRLDGEEYLKFDINRMKLHLDVEHVKVHHKENSPNDKFLANAADAVVNGNWRLVFGVLKPSYEEAFKQQIGKSLAGVFSTVPVDGIFLE